MSLPVRENSGQLAGFPKGMNADISICCSDGKELHGCQDTIRPLSSVIDKLLEPYASHTPISYHIEDYDSAVVRRVLAYAHFSELLPKPDSVKQYALIVCCGASLGMPTVVCHALKHFKTNVTGGDSGDERNVELVSEIAVITEGYSYREQEFFREFLADLSTGFPCRDIRELFIRETLKSDRYPDLAVAIMTAFMGRCARQALDKINEAHANDDGE